MKLDEKFSEYKRLLLLWNSSINLIGESTEKDIEQRHFKDSIGVSEHINSLESKILDIGTGAGFPGMVLAILGYKNVTLVEKNKKRVTFLKEVARTLDVSVNIVEDNIEDIHLEPQDFVTARAFTDLCGLIRLTHKFGHNGVFMKGASYKDEIIEAQKQFDFDYDVFDQKGSCAGVIIKVKNIREK